MKSIQAKVTKILSKVNVCSWCLGRQFTANLAVAEALGGSFGATPTHICELCNGAYFHRGEMIDVVLAELSQFEFDGVQVGVMVPKELVDREDELRANLKLSSGVGIKKALVSMYRSELRKRIPQQVHPPRSDVLVRINLATKSAVIEGRTASYYVRYVKLQRGIPTRAKTCVLCNGQGCITCFGLGIENEPPTVELYLVKELKRAFQPSKVKISWSGTDDDNSLVDGSGRPIFVQLSNPKFRISGIERLDMMTGGAIQLIQIEERDFDANFASGLKKLVEYSIDLSVNWTPKDRAYIESLFTDRIIPSATRNPKKIYWLNLTRTNGTNVKAVAYMDNGISPWYLLKMRHDSKDSTPGLIDLIGESTVVESSYDVLNFTWE